MKWIYFYRLTIGSFYADAEAAAHVIRSFKMGDDRILLYSRSRFCRSCSTNANRHGSPAHKQTKRRHETRQSQSEKCQAASDAYDHIIVHELWQQWTFLYNDVIIMTSHHYNGRSLYRTNDCIIMVCIIIQQCT